MKKFYKHIWLVLLALVGLHGFGETLVSESSYWYSWIDFAPDRVDPERARSELGDLISDRGQERLEDETLEVARHLGVNTEAPGFDWRDHIYLSWEPHISSPLVVPAGAPPATWFELDFDPSAAGWTRRAEPLQMGYFDKGNMFNSFMMVRSAYHRSTFHLDEIKPLKLSMVYRGGARIFINGKEIFRGHLPTGELTADTRAVGYKSAPYSTAFRFGGGAKVKAERQFDRSTKDLDIPVDLLRQGRNVIAIENRAPFVAPSAVTQNRSYGAAGPGGSRQSEFNIAYAHTGINRFELSTPDAEAANTLMRRPAGVQVWAGDIHQRYHDVDFLEAGGLPGALMVVGVPNGSFDTVMLIGSDRHVSGLRFEVADLIGPGQSRIPADRVRVTAMHGQEPTRELFLLTGDHRGEFTIKGPSDYAQWRYSGFAEKPTKMFDSIGAQPPKEVAAGQTQPVWIRIDLPLNTPPGVYRGQVAVAGQGMERRELPLMVSVGEWSLPNPIDYEIDVWIEQSPYGLAHAANLEPWSEQHWLLIEASLAHLGRIGADVVHVPVLQRSEFGNADDAMIRWSGDPNKPEQVKMDFSIMDRYLNLVDRYLGKPRAVAVNIMQGGGVDERLGGGKFTMDEYNTLAWVGRTEPVDITAHPQLYKVLARETVERFRARGWLDSLHWGFYWDHPPQDKLFDLMAQYAPEVYWIRGGHIAGGIHPRVRAQSEIFPSWEDRPEGAMHVVNPRRHCPVHILEGPSFPFSYRVLPERALAAGYTGFGRMGADYLGAWGKGNNIRGGVPDFGVKSLFWYEPGEVLTSQRFEVLREAVQEAEAYLFIRRHLEDKRLPEALRQQARQLLERRVGETAWVPAYFYLLNGGKLHDHSQGWQQRSFEIYSMASMVKKALN